MPFETPGSYDCDSEIIVFLYAFKVALGQSGLFVAKNSIWLLSVNDLFLFLTLNKREKRPGVGGTSL